MVGNFYHCSRYIVFSSKYTHTALANDISSVILCGKLPLKCRCHTLFVTFHGNQTLCRRSIPKFSFTMWTRLNIHHSIYTSIFYAFTVHKLHCSVENMQPSPKANDDALAGVWAPLQALVLSLAERSQFNAGPVVY